MTVEKSPLWDDPEPLPGEDTWLEVKCVYCFADPGERCKSLLPRGPVHIAPHASRKMLWQQTYGTQ